MRSLLTRRIEFPWLTKVRSILAIALSVRSLAAITIVVALLCGVAYLLNPRVGVTLGAWCEMIAGLGPIGCLFLVGLLFAAFLRTGKRERLWFIVGSTFGLAAFAGWCYAVTYH
jgi:hypothetical protein